MTFIIYNDGTILPGSYLVADNIETIRLNDRALLYDASGTRNGYIALPTSNTFSPTGSFLYGGLSYTGPFYRLRGNTAGTLTVPVRSILTTAETPIAQIGALWTAEKFNVYDEFTSGTLNTTNWTLEYSTGTSSITATTTGLIINAYAGSISIKGLHEFSVGEKISVHFAVYGSIGNNKEAKFVLSNGVSNISIHEQGDFETDLNSWCLIHRIGSNNVNIMRNNTYVRNLDISSITGAGSVYPRFFTRNDSNYSTGMSMQHYSRILNTETSTFTLNISANSGTNVISGGNGVFVPITNVAQNTGFMTTQLIASGITTSGGVLAYGARFKSLDYV